MTSNNDKDPKQRKDFPMHFLHNRLASYSDWPFDENCSCTPEKMSAAGFFHCPTENEPDLVKCFVCLKELDGWEPDDDPWQEHLKHSGKCPFLQFCNPSAPKPMPVESFLKLVKERQIIFLQKEFNQLQSQMQQYTAQARKQVESLVGPYK